MRNSVSDVTDAEILDEAREAMTQAAFDAADEANAAQAVESATESLPAFDELGLSDEMLRAIENLGYTAPTPVQAGSIPVVLEGRDLLAAAQTGTGKTAAFLLPTMNNLEHIAPPKPVRERGGRNRRRGVKKPEGNGRGPVMLVITPTRELAQQIDEVASKIADVTGHVAVTVVGGVSYKPQTAALKYGCDILVATPGRLVDLIEQGACHLDEVKVLVLDEADRMLDMGFSEDIMKIVSYMPKDRQTIMFSATLPPKIREMARTILRNPAEVNIAISKPNEAIDQSAYVCYENQKLGIIREMFAEPTDSKTIIFSSSKLKVKELAHTLKRMKLNVAAMHSDLEQAQREEVMLDFKNNKVSILVATDIVARGIDIEDIGLVINYDVPHDPEDYIHRIGRTARAAATGSAVTFVSEDEQGKFHAIEKFIERDIRKAELPASVGAGPVYNPAVNNGRGRGGRGGGRGRGGSNGGSRGRGRADKGERAGRERRNDRERGAAAAENPGIAVPQAAPADNDHASGRGEGNRGTRDRKHRHRGGRNRRRGDKPQGGETPQPGGSVPRE